MPRWRMDWSTHGLAASCTKAKLDLRERGEAVPHGVLPAGAADAHRDDLVPPVLIDEAAATLQGLG